MLLVGATFLWHRWNIASGCIGPGNPKMPDTYLFAWNVNLHVQPENWISTLHLPSPNACQPGFYIALHRELYVQAYARPTWMSVRNMIACAITPWCQRFSKSSPSGHLKNMFGTKHAWGFKHDINLRIRIIFLCAGWTPSETHIFRQEFSNLHSGVHGCLHHVLNPLLCNYA